jgi:L-ribulokinase
MQLLSDVLGTDIEVSSEAESCALGAAVNASVAAGVYPDIAAAQQAMCHVSSEKYRPSGTDHSARYARYRSL